MASQATVKRVQIVLAAAALVVSAGFLVERVAGAGHTCEFCGGRMQPFKYGDPEWFGCNIDECLDCGRMIDRDAWEFGSRLWRKEIEEARRNPPRRPATQQTRFNRNAVGPDAPRNRAHAL